MASPNPALREAAKGYVYWLDAVLGDQERAGRVAWHTTAEYDRSACLLVRELGNPDEPSEYPVLRQMASKSVEGWEPTQRKDLLLARVELEFKRLGIKMPSPPKAAAGVVGRALGVLADFPGIESVRDVAAKAECDFSLLYRSERFMAAWENAAASRQRPDRPRRKRRE